MRNTARLGTREKVSTLQPTLAIASCFRGPVLLLVSCLVFHWGLVCPIVVDPVSLKRVRLCQRFQAKKKCNRNCCSNRDSSNNTSTTPATTATTTTNLHGGSRKHASAATEHRSCWVYCCACALAAVISNKEGPKNSEYRYQGYFQ